MEQDSAVATETALHRMRKPSEETSEVLRALSLRAVSIARQPSGRACWECPEVVWDG